MTEQTPNQRRADHERYNRRTRAIERQAAATEAQAEALSRIADALTVTALADAASASARTSDGRGHVWTDATAQRMMDRVAAAVPKIVGR